MLAREHLRLRLVSLGPGEQWSYLGPGVAFVFAKEGAAHCVNASGVRTATLLPGGVLALSSVCGAKLCALRGAPVRFACFEVVLEHLFPLFAAREVGLLKHTTEAFKQPRLYPAASPLAAECQRLINAVQPQYTLEHRGQLLQVACEILTREWAEAEREHLRPVPVGDPKAQDFAVLSMTEIVQSSVEQLAAKLGCCRRQLNRLFHYHFGLSVAALKMEARLLKAASLLRDPGAKVVNVAEECGFHHLGLFSRCFKKRFGLNPAQWRESAAPLIPAAHGPGRERRADPVLSTPC